MQIQIDSVCKFGLFLCPKQVQKRTVLSLEKFRLSVVTKKNVSVKTLECLYERNEFPQTAVPQKFPLSAAANPRNSP